MESLAETALSAKAAVVVVWFVALFAAERLRPADPARLMTGLRPPELRRLGRNFVLFLANFALSPLIVVPLTAFAASLHAPWRPAWWQGGLGLALDVVVLDFLLYWWHRANHEVRFLWRFHSVHHLDATLDSTSAVRFHFGEVLLSALARAAVIVAVGFPLVSVLAFESLILIAAMFHHSNIALPPKFERALSRVVITPSIHWVHHHARRGDTDSNYGTVFSFWDPLFGSRSRTAREPGMTIGIEGESEETLIALLLHPFRAPVRRAA
jgi:sterol desaturase/sphingolipid hydroxylase (fatty acid hydroxylase superfamily)